MASAADTEGTRATWLIDDGTFISADLGVVVARHSLEVAPVARCRQRVRRSVAVCYFGRL
jgi:hypothetical protein